MAFTPQASGESDRSGPEPYLITFESVNSRRLEPKPYYSQTAKIVASFFQRHHLTGLRLNDDISARVWTNYIASLDYEHQIFLQSDIEMFAHEKTLLDDELKLGDVEFPFKVFEVFKERLKNRRNYVDELLQQEFHFDTQETYTWKRKNAPWPAGKSEWDDLWRRKIKNEKLRFLIAEEIKKLYPEPSRPPDNTISNSVETAALTPPTPEESIRKRYQQLLTITEDSDADSVFQRYLTAFASAFDPHSTYFSPSALEDFNIEMKLSLSGR